MEILIVAMIMAVVVKRGVEDIWHTARGNTPRRHSAQVLEKSGAGRKYWNALRDDTFEGMLRRHNERVARRAASPSKVARPRGAATQFFAGWLQDGRRAAGRKWASGWTVLDEKRREKATRPRPGQQTVPGTVVPNAQDEDRPQDGDRPVPAPVPDEDDRTVPQDEHPEFDEDGQDGPDSVPDYPPDSGPDQDIDPSPATPTTEGPTMTTTQTAEVNGLESGITFFEASADACREQVIRTEQTLAALDGFDVSGPARAEAASAMEQFSAAAESSRRVAEELKKHRVVAEAIDAVQGAGQREFYTAGR